MSYNVPEMRRCPRCNQMHAHDLTEVDVTNEAVAQWEGQWICVPCYEELAQMNMEGETGG